MQSRSKSVCEICGKEHKCKSWHFIVKNKNIGRVRTFVPGHDIVYKSGGREVDREKNTVYAMGTEFRDVSEDTVFICMRCRAIWSIVLGLILFILISLMLIAVIFLLTLLILKLAEKPIDNLFDAEIIKGILLFVGSVTAIYTISPWMRHLILKLKLAKKYHKIDFWNITSHFWAE